MNKYLELVGYARPVYRKCELCKRVKDVCKHCASNMGEIIRIGG